MILNIIGQKYPKTDTVLCDKRFVISYSHGKINMQPLLFFDIIKPRRKEHRYEVNKSIYQSPSLGLLIASTYDWILIFPNPYAFT